MKATVNAAQAPNADDLHEQAMEDPQYRREYERTQLANDVAVTVVGSRIEHGLTWAGIARLVGMRQPHVVRLEAGDHEPSVGAWPGWPTPLARTSAWMSSRPGAAPQPRTLGQAACRRHTQACVRPARSTTMVVATWTGAAATAILAVGACPPAEIVCWA